MKQYIERTALLLDAYKRRLEDVQEKNSFLERENVQLRKCLYDENSNNSNKTHNNTITATTSAGRYQNIK